MRPSTLLGNPGSSFMHASRGDLSDCLQVVGVSGVHIAPLETGDITENVTVTDEAPGSIEILAVALGKFDILPFIFIGHFLWWGKKRHHLLPDGVYVVNLQMSIHKVTCFKTRL